MLPQAKEFTESPEAGRRKEGFSLRTSRGSAGPQAPLIPNSGLQNRKRINVFCLSHPVCDILIYFSFRLSRKLTQAHFSQKGLSTFLSLPSGNFHLGKFTLVF